MDYEIGQEVLTDRGEALVYMGNGIFKNTKTGLTSNALEIGPRIKYEVVGNRETPLELPTMNSGGDKEPVTANAGIDSPLDLPVMKF